MNNLKKLLIASVVAASTALTGCGSLKDVNDRGQALRTEDPAAYETMTGEANYFSINPKFNVHGS